MGNPSIDESAQKLVTAIVTGLDATLAADATIGRADFDDTVDARLLPVLSL